MAELRDTAPLKHTIIILYVSINPKQNCNSLHYPLILQVPVKIKANTERPSIKLSILHIVRHTFFYGAHETWFDHQEVLSLLTVIFFILAPKSMFWAPIYVPGFDCMLS